LNLKDTKTPHSILSFCAGGVMVLALLAGYPAYAAAAEPDARGAEQFARTLESSSLKFMTDKNIPRATRARHVREVIEHSFNLQAMGRFAMGTYWRSASDAQRKEYMALFEKELVNQYTTRFEDFGGMTVKPVTVTPAGDHDFIVSREARPANGMAVGYEWRVRAEDGGFRIVDLTVMNISMCATERGAFAEIIQRGGGSVEALLYALRKQDKTRLAQND
jgi:phospholipid transport system substrate-binding protein